MNIDDLTIADARAIAALFGCALSPVAAQKQPEQAHPYKIGDTYLFRTVTMIDVGRLVGVFEHELAMESVSWVADTGRFSEALKTGTLGEVEPFPDGTVIIGRGAIVDGAKWNHTLPRTVK
jgi:hypothetical protein